MKRIDSNLSLEDVIHVAKLANLFLSKELIKKFQSELSSIISYMSKIQKVDTLDVRETAQVTHLKNIFREDVVDKRRMFSQKDALRNAKKTKNGYFVVPAVFQK